jgi:anthranilate synthase component 2
MLLMIDNYDSFTYNLVQYFGELGQEVRVFRNDAITVAEIARLKPAWLVISPGPCAPVQAGVSLAAIREFAGKIPLFGVCLGHQAIGEAFGGRVVHARKLMHGKVSPVHHNQHGVFRGLPSPLTCTRYHSLAVERGFLAGLPGDHGLDRRRRDHGFAPSHAGRRRGSVSPRVDPQREWPRPVEELP